MSYRVSAFAVYVVADVCRYQHVPPKLVAKEQRR